jgi:hypothetical protein
MALTLTLALDLTLTLTLISKKGKMLKKHTQKNKIKTLKKQNKIIKHYPMTD